MKATQNAIAHPAEIGQWLKSLLEATWGNPWWDRKKSKCKYMSVNKCKYMSVNEETQPIIWQSMHFDCFGMGLSLVPKKSYIYRTSMADDGSQISPEWPRMACRLVLVRKSPTVRTEGFDAFFCTRRSSWKLARCATPIPIVKKLLDDGDSKQHLCLASTHRLRSYVLANESNESKGAWTMCPAFEFASISSSTRASSTRTWSGALICQTRYFFKKIWKQNLHQFAESSLDDLDVFWLGCFTSLRLDDAVSFSILWEIQKSWVYQSLWIDDHAPIGYMMILIYPYHGQN